MKIVKITLLILSIYEAQYIRTATIGSDSAVNRFQIQQVLNNNDRIATFAALEGGFRLLNKTTTGYFDSIFPVTGDVALNFGTLILQSDLIFDNVTSFVTLGNIIGNSHAIELPPMDTCLGLGNEVFSCGVSFLLSDLNQPADIETVDWSYDDEYIAVGLGPNGTATLKIYEFDGVAANLILSSRLENTSAEVTTVRWHPTKYWIAVGREQESGPSEFFIVSFDPNAVSVTILDSINNGNSFLAAEWRPDGDYVATVEDDDNRLSVYPVDNAGILGTPFQVTLPGDVTIPETTQVLSWDVTGMYLVVGTRTSGSQELRVYKFDPADTGSELTLNAAQEMNSDVRAVSWNQTFTADIAVGLSNDDLMLYRHNGNVGSLTQLGSTLDVSQDVRALHWSPNGHCLALGRDPGADSEFRIYEYDDILYTLSLVSEFGFGESVEEVRWSRSGQFIANGSDSNIFSIYEVNSVIIENGQCITLDNVKLFLNCNATLKNCCITFSGNSVLGGKGYCLSLSPTCTILVDSDSTLLVKDITIKGIHDTIIQGVDATSTFSFQDVELVLDGDYSFTVGRFAVTKDLDIVGSGYAFNYESDQISTIEACGCMTVHKGVIFNYAPSVSSDNRIQLVTDTSKIALCGGIIQVQEPGWQLLKGEFIVKNRSFICAENYAALTMGDGSLESNNLNVHVFPAATLEILKGCVEYNNI